MVKVVIDGASYDAKGLLSLLQKFCSKDSRRTMGATAELLESVGKGLKH
jgi:hypothetical protein